MAPGMSKRRGKRKQRQPKDEPHPPPPGSTEPPGTPRPRLIEALLALALFFNAFINASVSGDLNDNRWLFATLGLLLVAANPALQNSQHSSSIHPVGAHKAPVAL